MIPLSFVPSSRTAFGRLDRAGLENYSGPADIWFEGHELHIIPWSEGTFTGTVTLYAGNLYIAKPVVFRVGEQTERAEPLRGGQLAGLLYRHLERRRENSVYTVFAYLDEQCTQLYRSLETDSYLYFNTDVGTQALVCRRSPGPVRQYPPFPRRLAQPIEPFPAPENLTGLLSDGAVIPSWSPVPAHVGLPAVLVHKIGVWSPETDGIPSWETRRTSKTGAFGSTKGQTLFSLGLRGQRGRSTALLQVSRGRRDTGIDQFTDLLNDEEMPEISGC